MADSSGRSTAKPEDRERGTPDALDASLDPAPTFTPIDTSRGRFKRNVLANLIYFVFNAGIQLWFVRYLIDNLGVATYGLVPLATNITNYMAIITVALSGSVGRFLTIDLARGDLATANRTFNTSLFASIVLAVALVPVAGALSWFAPSFLNVPTGEETGTRFLLMCTCFAFLLNAVGSNFACSTFAKNRFDVQRGIDALGFITQVGAVVALFSWAEGDLWYVGAGVAASAVVRQVGYQVSWRKLTPELAIRLRAFDRTRLREILGMGGWLAVDHSGFTVLRHLDLLLVNVLVGASAAGVYALGLQWSIVLGAIVGTALTALVPTLTAYHGRGAHERLAEVLPAAMRLVGLAMALPIGLVAGLSVPLAHAWVGAAHSELPPLIVLLTLPLSLQFAQRPLAAVPHAMNRLMWPGIMCWVTGVINIGMALVAARVWNLGMFGVAGAIMAGWTLKNAIFAPLYTAHILRRPLLTFLPGLLPGVGSALAVTGLAWSAARLLPYGGWTQVLLGSVATSLAYITLLFALVLTPEEKGLLRLRTTRSL